MRAGGVPRPRPALVSLTPPPPPNPPPASRAPSSRSWTRGKSGPSRVRIAARSCTWSPAGTCLLLYLKFLITMARRIALSIAPSAAATTMQKTRPLRLRFFHEAVRCACCQGPTTHPPLRLPTPLFRVSVWSRRQCEEAAPLPPQPLLLMRIVLPTSAQYEPESHGRSCATPRRSTPRHTTPRRTIPRHSLLATSAFATHSLLPIVTHLLSRRCRHHQPPATTTTNHHARSVST